MARTVCRCVDVYVQLSDNVGWRKYQEMSEKNRVDDSKYISAV